MPVCRGLGVDTGGDEVVCPVLQGVRFLRREHARHLLAEPFSQSYRESLEAVMNRLRDSDSGEAPQDSTELGLLMKHEPVVDAPHVAGALLDQEVTELSVRIVGDDVDDGQRPEVTVWALQHWTWVRLEGF